MSERRGDCEHSHAEAVIDMAIQIAADHGFAAMSAVLVLVGPSGEKPIVIGQYNTAALFAAGDAILDECARHTPDGCTVCDPAAKSAELARDVMRAEFPLQVAKHQRRRAN